MENNRIFKRIKLALEENKKRPVEIAEFVEKLHQMSDTLMSFKFETKEKYKQVLRDYYGEKAMYSIEEIEDAIIELQEAIFNIEKLDKEI